jgi:hypothetical protein
MFKVSFKISNDAFKNGYGREETARVLRKIAEQVETGYNGKKVIDVNGNTVGAWSVIPNKTEKR